MKMLPGLFFCLMAFPSCTTINKTNQMEREPFEKIKFGATQAEVKKYFPLSAAAKDPITGLVIMALHNQDKELAFVFDSSGSRVIGKYKTVDVNADRTQLPAALRSIFGDPSFVRYVPCHTWNQDEQILIDEKNGYVAATSRTGPIFVSWEAPELIKFRIENQYKNCPNLQPARVKN